MNKNKYYAVQVPPELQEAPSQIYLKDYTDLYFLADESKIEDYGERVYDCAYLRSCPNTKVDSCIACGLDCIRSKTGKKWEIATLTGLSQGDYIKLLYDASLYNDKDLQEISAYYFNIGTEWRIFEVPENISINSVEDLGAYDEILTCYCTEDDYIKQLKDFIASIYGDAAELKQVFEFIDYSKVANYKKGLNK